MVQIVADACCEQDYEVLPVELVLQITLVHHTVHLKGYVSQICQVSILKVIGDEQCMAKHKAYLFYQESLIVSFLNNKNYKICLR